MAPATQVMHTTCDACGTDTAPSLFRIRAGQGQAALALLDTVAKRVQRDDRCAQGTGVYRSEVVNRIKNHVHKYGAAVCAACALALTHYSRISYSLPGRLDESSRSASVNLPVKE